MWPAVWAGTSITSASTAPSATVSPSPTWRSSVGMRAASAAGPVTVQPVAALIAALPPVWSGCQWVFQIWVIRQPRASRLGQHRLGDGRIDHRRLARLRLVDQPDIIVAEDRDADDLEHGAQLRRSREHAPARRAPSRSVSSRAGSGRPSRAAWPAHIGLKPGSPRAAAALASGASAAVASG